MNSELTHKRGGARLAGTHAHRAAIAAPDLDTFFGGMSLELRYWLEHAPEIIEPDEDWLVAAFFDVAATDPAGIAVDDAGVETTYGELSQRVRQVACRLAAMRVNSGKVVAVHGPLSTSVIAVILGVLARGAAFALVDPEMPLERRDALIDQLAPDLIVEQSVSGRADAHRRIDVAALLQGELSASVTELAEPAPETPAYVFFTSGSTGTPKGVVGNHRGLSHFLRWQRSTFDIGAGDRIAQVTALSFDVVLREIFTPLTSGATLCLRGGVSRRSSRDMLAWLAAIAPTVIHCVPTLARHWLAHGSTGAKLPLRLTFFAGEPLSWEMAAEWRRSMAPRSEIVNLYGPTETTLAKFFYRLPLSAPLERDGVIPVGDPLPGADFAILKDGRPIAPGEVGEIFIRTPFATNGYLRQGADVEGRFLSLEVRGGKSATTIYRTGDLGRVTVGGALALAGRTDQQFKVGGVRLEAGEIENLIRQCDRVADAVIVVAKRNEGVRIVAFWVGKPDCVEQFDLRAECAPRLLQMLPAAAVPGQFIRLQALPMTASGKVNRNALVLPAEETAVETAHATSARILPIWQRLFTRRSVVPSSNFFSLGGDSLLAIELAMELETEFGVEIPHEAIMFSPDIATLERRIVAGEFTNATPIPPADTRAPDRMSPQQERFHGLMMQPTDRTWSNSIAMLTVPRRLSEATVSRAWRCLIDRHDSLRTTFVAQAGTTCPVYGSAAEIDVQCHQADEGDVAPYDVASKVAGRRVRELIPIDRWPLFRIDLILGPDRSVVIWSMHHMITDGESHRIIAKELRQCTDAIDADQQPGLPALPIGYRDYTHWAHANLNGPAGERLREYWRKALPASYVAPCLSIPTNSSGSHVTLNLTAEMTTAIRRTASHCRVTSYIVHFAAWSIVLFGLTGRKTLIVNSLTSGRTHSQLRAVVGNFYGAIPVCIDFDMTKSFAAFASELSTKTANAVAHQEYTMDRILADRGVPIRPDVYPLTTLGISQVVEDPEMRLPRSIGQNIESGELPVDVRYDLQAIVSERDARDVIALRYRRGMLHETKMHNVARALQQTLQAAAEDPRRSLSELMAPGDM